MPHILIAAFDQYEDARRSQQQLRALGVDDERIQLSMASNPALVQNDHEVPIEAGHEEPLGERISAFFQRLFGEQHAQHSGRYPEAMHRGSTLLSVQLDDDTLLRGCIDCLEGNGAIDVDQRASQWQERPATASTEALTTGYPQATSIHSSEAEAGDERGEDHARGSGAIPGRMANARAGQPGGPQAGRVHVVTR